MTAELNGWRWILGNGCDITKTMTFKQAAFAVWLPFMNHMCLGMNCSFKTANFHVKVNKVRPVFHDCGPLRDIWMDLWISEFIVMKILQLRNLLCYGKYLFSLSFWGLILVSCVDSAPECLAFLTVKLQLWSKKWRTELNAHAER